MNVQKLVRILTVFAAALWLQCLAADPVESALVRIKANASVASTLVRLADVADVLDPDPKTVEKLRQIVLGPAPVVGSQLRLDFATIRSRLQACGVDMSQIEFNGKSIVTVTFRDKLQPARKLKKKKVADWKTKWAERLVVEAIRQYVARRTPELGSVSVELRIEAKDVELIRLGAVSGYEIRGGQPPWQGPQSMAVRFLDRNEKLYEVRVVARLSADPRVLVAKYAVPRGHLLRAADLAWRQMNRPGAALTRFEEVVGRETKRPIRQGQPIQAQDIRSVPLIRHNDIVTAVARRPGITVKRQLKARSDGSIGETVTLVTLDGRERVLARVTGFHEAEVIGANATATNTLQDTHGRIEFRTAKPPKQPQMTNEYRNTAGGGKQIRISKSEMRNRFQSQMIGVKNH